MQRFIFWSAFLLLGAMPAQGRDEGAPNGWNFVVGLAAFHNTSDPKLKPIGNLFGSDTTKNIESLTPAKSSASQTTVAPNVQITYTDNKGQWSIGRVRPFIFGVARQQKLENSRVQLALGYSPGSEYDNLYDLNTKRRITSGGESGVAASYDYGQRRDLLKFGIGAAYSNRQLNSDSTAKSHPDLGRSGARERLSAKLGIAVFNYEYAKINFKAIGAADAYQGTRQSLSAFVPLGIFFAGEAMSLILTYSTEERNYTAENPVFSKKRTETQTGSGLIFNWRINTSISFNGFYRSSNTSSNIDFFTTKSSSIGTAFGYHF